MDRWSGSRPSARSRVESQRLQRLAGDVREQVQAERLEARGAGVIHRASHVGWCVTAAQAAQLAGLEALGTRG